MENKILNNRYLQARQQVKKIKGFYIHLIIYIGVNLLIIAGNIYEGKNFLDMDNFYTAIFWGIGLLIHGMTVNMPNFIFGKNWEEKKIREILDKNHSAK